LNVLLIVLAGLVLLFIPARILFFLVDVQGGSMRPALEPGDQVLVLRFYPAHWLRQGQIVVLRFPAGEEILEIYPSSAERVLYIKRLIGLPGDTVSIPLAELPASSQQRRASQNDIQQGRRVWHIPAGHGFVKGDSFGLDSTILGPIPVRDVLGVVVTKLRRPARSAGAQERTDFDDAGTPFA
jgi:signal peptidase I